MPKNGCSIPAKSSATARQSWRITSWALQAALPYTSQNGDCFFSFCSGTTVTPAQLVICYISQTVIWCSPSWTADYFCLSVVPSAFLYVSNFFSKQCCNFWKSFQVLAKPSCCTFADLINVVSVPLSTFLMKMLRFVMDLQSADLFSCSKTH